MLDRYIETTAPLLPIVFIDENFYMDIRGTIYHNTGVGYTPIETGRTPKITICGVSYTVKRENLVQLVWKPVYPEDLMFYLLEADVLFSDLNEFNYHPINLIWKLKDNRIGDMFRIPGFSRYLFTEDFQLFDRDRNTFLKVTYEKDRYVSTNVYPDFTNGKKTKWYVVHRMVAYCFVDYLESVCRMDVNHIDGNKWNFHKDNLEFTTRRGNNLHAIMFGLKTDNNVIRVYNQETKETQEYISQAECAKALNLDKKLLSWRLIHGADKIWDGKYKFTVLGRGSERGKYATEPKMVILKNQVSGEIVELSSLGKAADFLNIGYSALKKRVSRNSNIFGEWELKAYNPKIGESKPTF